MNFSIQAQNSPFRFTPNYGLEVGTTALSFVGISDLNKDSFDDLILFPVSGSPVVHFFSPDSGKFVHYNDTLIVHNVTRQYGGALFLDLDGNDLPEIHTLYNSNDPYEAWALDLSDSTFKSVETLGGFAASATLDINSIGIADFNGDGRLDALVGTDQGSRTQLDVIYYNVFNKGNALFFQDNNSEITLQGGPTTSFSIASITNDIFPEVYRSNRVDKQKLFLGTETGLIDQLGHELAVTSQTYVGLFADLTGDGVLDFYRSNNAARNNFMQGLGNLRFSSVQIGAPVLENNNSRGAHFGDFDNDGDLDLAVAEFGEFVGLFQNQGNNTFAKLTLDVIPVNANWFSVVFFDPDKNGQLDLLTSSATTNLNKRFYQNEGNSNNWIGFTLESTNGYFSEAIGARIILNATISNNNVTQIREVYPTNAYKTFLPLSQHFGLRDASTASAIITWPSGLEQTLTLDASSINKYNVVKEPARSRITQENSLVLSSTTGTSVQDTLLIRNVGFATATITNVVSSFDGVEVLDFSRNINPDTVGFVAIRYNPLNTHGFSLADREITVVSNSISVETTLRYQTRNRGQGAPYIKVDSENDPFFNITSLFDYGVLGKFHENESSMDESIVLFSQDGLTKTFFNTDSIRFPEYRPFSDTLFSTLIEDLQSADLNNDGFQDIIVAYQRDGDVVWLNNQENGFYADTLGEISAEPSATSDITLHDFNGDGYLEMLFLSRDNQRNRFYRNIDGTFVSHSAADYTFFASNGINQIVLDINNDGFDDILVCENTTFSSTNLSVYYGDAGMQFYRTGQNPFDSYSAQLNGIIPLDFNNDTFMDLLFLPSNPDSSFKMFFGASDGWTSHPEIESNLKTLVGNPSDVTVLDYNLDGWSDLYISYSSFVRPNLMLLNVSGISLTPIADGDLATYTNVSTSTSLLIDSNKDAIPDILVVNEDSPNALFINTTSIEATDQKWFAIRPKVRFPDGTSTIIPETIVKVTSLQDGEPVTQTRVVGKQSLKSVNMSALYFGIDKAETANVVIEFTNGATMTSEVVANGQYVDIELDSGPVSNEHEPHLPSSFGIVKNFPNPFNPSTNIQFTLTESSEITLEIFSLTGEKVWTFTSPMMTAGAHRVAWAAKNIASGIYIAKLRANGLVSTHKMTLIK